MTTVDFERWFQQQGRPAPAGESEPGLPSPAVLPDGLWEDERAPGKLFYRCRSCEKAIELDYPPEEFDQDMAYCGGSPRCLP